MIVKIFTAVVFILLIVIGILCYQISINTFYNYLIFMVPMALLRFTRSILLIKIQK